ncbi:transporter substrate-binding domain-containing protein [Psychrobium sp. MM17-31]|uniref:transporter substrate-binding domain-containing protein n=1 Tax=Psychrobium sp. MM17-31 TaxID=2917758 RepID=UPI001EF47A71|nr:transporter substrate-binding domain-containing protein [Psychrobium sp. MM17-31]MCG7530674.1 transporter substrate-binding domain-containing protein [Psychrobium sp. MM17-31]
MDITQLKLGLLSLLFSVSLSAETIVVGISKEPNPPFSYRNLNGPWQGVEIELIDAICKQAKLQCRLKPVPSDDLLKSLSNKKIDVIMSSYEITPRLFERIDFTDRYYHTPLLVLSKKKEDSAPSKPIEDIILGLRVTSIPQIYAQKYLANIQTKMYHSSSRTIINNAKRDLISGKIDALIEDAITVDRFLDTHDGNCCEITQQLPIDAEIQGYGVGAGLLKGQDKLKQRLNDAIKATINNGDYQKITEKYFHFKMM